MNARRLLPGLVRCAAVACASVACASGGQWGHQRHYTPLGDEEAAIENSTEYDPVMANRSPEKWRNKAVHLFGVVMDQEPAPGGLTQVTLSMRAQEPRNLCETAEEDSCRVTVSEREHARINVIVKLKPEDELGAERVGVRSLLRVVGVPGDEPSASGLPVVRARYYRHWPRNYYVTTAARTYMRR